MSIFKHDIPILEYDTDPSAVIMPNHEGLDLHLPKKAVFAFLGDEVDRYATAHGAKRAGTFVSATKEYPVYVLEYQGEDVCLCQAPVGAAPSAQLLDWLIGYGVKQIISAGSCGALQPFPENVFLVPTRALRDEGTSYHYLAPSRFAEIHPDALSAIQRSLQKHGLDYREVISWTTDGFFRETKDKVAYRRSEGCAVVEMECAALAAVAALRNAVWGEILFTADTLADMDRYDERGWGGSSVSLALTLCMDAVRYL